MNIQETNYGKVPVDYVIIQGMLPDIDFKYFKEEIDKGVVQDNNKNYKTNVKGLMTNWTYFNNNNKFLNLLSPIIEFIKSFKKISRCGLHSSWGIKENFNDFTAEHDHIPGYLSGIIYFENHEQALHFPEINISIKPEKNKFLIFSSFLKHKTKKNVLKKCKYAISFNLQAF